MFQGVQVEPGIIRDVPGQQDRPTKGRLGGSLDISSEAGWECPVRAVDEEYLGRSHVVNPIIVVSN